MSGLVCLGCVIGCVVRLRWVLVCWNIIVGWIVMLWWCRL